MLLSFSVWIVLHLFNREKNELIFPLRRFSLYIDEHLSYLNVKKYIWLGTTYNNNIIHDHRLSERNSKNEWERN